MSALFLCLAASQTLVNEENMHSMRICSNLCASFANGTPHMWLLLNALFETSELLPHSRYQTQCHHTFQMPAKNKTALELLCLQVLWLWCSVDQQRETQHGQLWQERVNFGTWHQRVHFVPRIRNTIQSQTKYNALFVPVTQRCQLSLEWFQSQNGNIKPASLPVSLRVV